MQRINPVQFFSLLAIIAGGLVSYFPPKENGVVIWSLISSFLTYGVRDLFEHGRAPASAPAPAVVSAKEGGFARLTLLVLLAVGDMVVLSACGALNAYTGAALNSG